MHDLCAGQEVGCVVTSVLGRRSPTPWIACEVLPLSPASVPPVLCLAPLVLVGRIWIRCVVFWLLWRALVPAPALPACLACACWSGVGAVPSVCPGRCFCAGLGPFFLCVFVSASMAEGLCLPRWLG